MRNYRNMDRKFTYLDLITLFESNVTKGGVSTTAHSSDMGDPTPQRDDETNHAPQDAFGFPGELFEQSSGDIDGHFPDVPDIGSILASEYTVDHIIMMTQRQVTTSFPAFTAEIGAHLETHEQLMSPPQVVTISVKTRSTSTSDLAGAMLQAVEVLRFIECRFTLGPKEEIDYLKAVFTNISISRWGLQLGHERQRRMRDLEGVF
jgi:hypothetical protein